MKLVITAIFILISLIAFGQQITYTQWIEDAKSDIRLLPEYGNITKRAAKKIDRELISEITKQDRPRDSISEDLVAIGFKYYYRGDFKTAMYRFNEAWLLNPNNENAYWGFGTIYFKFNSYLEALKMYNKGLELNPNNSNILTDKACVYMIYAGLVGNKPDNKFLAESIELFKRSYSIDPQNKKTAIGLSILYFHLSDCENAIKYYEEFKKNGGQPITEEYTKVLFEKCKK